MKKLLSIIVLAAMLLTTLVAVSAEEYTAMAIADALAAADGTLVEVSGKVVSVDIPWNATKAYMSVTIEDASGNKLYIYRLGTKVELGNGIKVQGKMATYSENRQIAAGGTATVTDPTVTPITYTPMTIAQINEAADGTYVELSGTVKSVKTAWNTSFGNMDVYVTDAAGAEILVYRIYTQVEVGDIVTIKGTVDTYSGAKQIGEGSTAEKKGNDATVTTEAATTTTEAPEDLATPGGEKKGTLLGTFGFGDNVTGADVAHKDGNDVTEDTATFTSGEYTLKVEGFEKVYAGANDAKGNSALKLGTGSKVGKFSFTVPANVQTVVIKIAAYKANTAKVEVNGKLYQITTKSNDGDYTEIVVDTTETKKVELTTVASGYRAMVDSIAYYGTAAASVTTKPADTTKPAPTGDATAAVVVALVAACAGAVLTLKKKH